MTHPVLFDEIAGRDGWNIGVATLNSPKTLNSLTLAMCQSLDSRLQSWQANPRIAAVVLRGAGDKAFCAGGDLHGLYKGMQATPVGAPWANAVARDFFSTEYRLDHRIHTYNKPILCWGSGIVMGGGVGLMQGASHRLVTETTRYAMPEITIGLYPDVAGTWMLARLPRGIGAFLALTGSQLGAPDCLHYGLADRLLPADALDALTHSLTSLAWSADPAEHATQIDSLLDALELDTPQPGPLQKYASAIRRVCNRTDLLDISEHMSAFDDHGDAWLARAARTFRAGSPGSARLSLALMEQARHLSLADAFRAEFIASMHCCAEPDFREGIRALLIDKDKTPHWQPATLEQATNAWVARFFQQPWPDHQAHPLADLQSPFHR